MDTTSSTAAPAIAATPHGDAAMPAQVLIALGDCPPGRAAALDGEQIVILGPPDDGSVPVITPGGALRRIAASTLVHTDRDRDHATPQTAAITHLFRALQLAQHTQERLQDALADSDEQLHAARREAEQNLESIRRAAIDHHRTRSPIGADGVTSEHAREEAPAPSRNEDPTVPATDPAALHRIADAAGAMTAALSELYDAWQQVARSDPRLDEWLCENYPFDQDLLEVLVDGVDWAHRITEASRAHDNADNGAG